MLPSELAGLVLIFAATTLAARAILQMTADARRRLQATDGLALQLGREASTPGRLDTLLPGIRRDLGRAGLEPGAATAGLGLAVLWGLGVGGAAFVLALAVGLSSGLSTGVLSAVVLGVSAGASTLTLRLHDLRHKADRRVSHVVRQLPYSLDLCVLAMAAGSSFDEAIRLLLRDLPDEPLHEELAQVQRDQKLGRSRRDSFQAMAERLKVDDINTLVLGLEIGEDLGTPIAESLKRQAEGARHARLLRAERLAREASSKMTLPNTLILVANVLLILAPFIPRLVSGGGVI